MKHISLPSAIVLVVFLSGCELNPMSTATDAEVVPQSSQTLSTSTLPEDIDRVAITELMAKVALQTGSLTSPALSWEEAQSQADEIIQTHETSQADVLVRQTASIAMLRRHDAEVHTEEALPFLQMLLDAGSTEISVIAPALDHAVVMWGDERVSAAAAEVLERLGPTATCDDCDAQTRALMDEANTKAAGAKAEAIQTLNELRDLDA